MLNICRRASDQWYCWQSVITLPISTETYPFPTVSRKSTCYDTCLVECNESGHQTSCVISGILTKHKCQNFKSDKNLTVQGWKMTLVNAQCDTVQAKCQLKLSAKNIWRNQWPVHSCVSCRVSSAFNLRTKGLKTIQSSETEGLTKVMSKQGSELPLFHLCRKYLQSVWSNEDK